MSHDDTIRKSMTTALKAQGFALVWRSISEGPYDPDSLTYGEAVATDHQVVGAVYSGNRKNSPVTGAETAEIGASAVHKADVECTFPVPPEGLGFTPAVGDRIIWGGDEWRVSAILPVKGVAEVVAYQAWGVHG